MKIVTVTEFGFGIIIGVSFDMTANTAILFRFKRGPNTPVTALLEVTATLGTVDIDTTVGEMLANEWATYTFVDGDIPECSDGEWQVQLVYQATGVQLLSTIGEFTVDDEFIASP